MAADEMGNDVGAVFIPLTGHVGVAMITDPKKPPALPDIEAVGKYDFKLGAEFTKLGLLKKDGGPELAMEADGDPLEFWQDGYSIPTGLSKVTLKITLAQTDPTTQEFVRGAKYDQNHHMIVDAGGNTTPFYLYVEEIARNKMIRRRLCESAMVQGVAEAKSERGEIVGYEVTIKLNSGGRHAPGQFHEYLIPADSSPAPVPPAPNN